MRGFFRKNVRFVTGRTNYPGFKRVWQIGVKIWERNILMAKFPAESKNINEMLENDF